MNQEDHAILQRMLLNRNHYDLDQENHISLRKMMMSIHLKGVPTNLEMKARVGQDQKVAVAVAAEARILILMRNQPKLNHK